MTRNSTVLLMALTVAADFAQRLKTVACNCLAVRLRGCLRSTRRGTDCLYAAAWDLPAPNRALRDIEARSSALYCLSVPWTFSRDGLHRESQEVRNPDLSDAAFMWFPRRENPTLYDRLMHECFRGGLKSPRIVQEGLDEATILSLVATGLGVAWVLGTARRPPPANVQRFPGVRTVKKG